MPTFTVELDDICEWQRPYDERMKWQDPRIRHPTWLRIGPISGPRLFADPCRGALLSATGTAVYAQLLAIADLDVWGSDLDDVRRQGKLLARHEDLQCEYGAGFNPALNRLMRLIVAGLAKCNLGPCRIRYVVSERAKKAQAPWGDLATTKWPRATVLA
jgi:hypothetical protein